MTIEFRINYKKCTKVSSEEPEIRAFTLEFDRKDVWIYVDKCGAVVANCITGSRSALINKKAGASCVAPASTLFIFSNTDYRCHNMFYIF